MPDSQPSTSRQAATDGQSKANQVSGPFGDPVAASANKAMLNSQSQTAQKLPPDEQIVKTFYGDDGLRMYREEKRKSAEFDKLPPDEQVISTLDGEDALPPYRQQKQEVQREFVDARQAYLTTGKVPENLKHWAPIEIEKGQPMSRAERYDMNVKSQGLDPSTDKRIDDHAVDPRYLTPKENLDEWKSRMNKAWDACEDNYIRPGKIQKCQRGVSEQFGGPVYMEEHDAKVRDFVMKTQAYTEAIQNSGPEGLAGRGIGRAIGYGVGYATGGKERADKWADKGEEWGAVVTGPADGATQAYGSARGQVYHGASTPTSDHEVKTENAPPPEKNINETKPDVKTGAGGSSSKGAGDVGRPPNTFEAADTQPAPKAVTQPDGLAGKANRDAKQIGLADTQKQAGPPPAAKGGPGTVDTSSPKGAAASLHTEYNPDTDPNNMLNDPRKVTVNTTKGPEEMTRGTYLRRYHAAEKWVSEQLSHHPDPKWADHADLDRQAAEKFGLDKNWRSVANPIVHGEL